MLSLFRPEALETNRQRLFGEINLAQPRHLMFWSFAFGVLLVLLLGFLLFTDLHRKEKVVGTLAPSGGLLHITADRSGTVAGIYVSQNEEVDNQTPLIAIENPQEFGINRSLQHSLETQLRARLDYVSRALSDHQRLTQQELANNRMHLAELKAEQAVLKQQKHIVGQRIGLQTMRLSALKSLSQDKHLSRFELTNTEDSLLGLQQLEAEISQKILASQHQQRMVADNGDAIPVKHELNVNELAAERARLKQRLAEVKASTRKLILARQPATITSLQVVVGQQVSVGDNLLSLVPQNSTLVAELYFPTRSAGMVAVGDKANLRLDAFPYQKFGQIEGEIIQVDRTLFRSGRNQTQTLEPAYRVRASLAEQTLLYKSLTYPLKPGMMLEADVLLEERRLFDWLVEPLLGMSERLQ